MKKITIHLPEITLLGITTRTSNAAEMNPASAKISTTMQRYMQNGIAQGIPHRKKPGTTFCVYTDYESDFTATYTYFIGEEVTAFDNLTEGLKMHIIPAQVYTKFTTEPGTMPGVVIEAWQKIWQMPAEQLGGKRSYRSDFEIYDERATDYEKAVLDIYIGIEI